MGVGQIVEPEGNISVANHASYVARCIMMEHHFIRIGTLYKVDNVRRAIAKIGAKS